MSSGYTRGGACYKCGEEGHISRDCPQGGGAPRGGRGGRGAGGRGGRGGAGGDVTCYKCGEAGHMSGQCPQAGHSASACYKCGQEGHISRQCPGGFANTPDWRDAAATAKPAAPAGGAVRGGRGAGPARGRGGHKPPGAEGVSLSGAGGGKKMVFGDDGATEEVTASGHRNPNGETTIDADGKKHTYVDGAEHEKKAFKPSVRAMATVVTESGTEVPERLNNKVFIDQLPYDEPAEGPGLEQQLAQFVQDWKVGRLMHLIKKPGQGFGYLAFRSPNSVQVAVKVLNGRKFLGRTLRIEEPKGKRDDGTSTTLEKSSFTRQVLLTDLSKISEPEVIREVLKSAAPQLEERVEIIKLTSRNRKAFVTMASDEDVEPFVNFMNGFSLLGRTIGAEVAKPPGSLTYGAAKLTPGGQKTANDAQVAANTDTVGAANSGVVKFDDDEEDDSFVPLGATAPAKKNKAANDGEQKVEKAYVATSKTGAPKVDLYDQGPKEVFIGNLTEETSTSQLKSHFSTCGTIKKCEMYVNPVTKLPSGIGRVEFTLPGHAAIATEKLHGSRLNGNLLRVDRGDVSSGDVGQKEQAPEDEVDEAAYMKHYGVKNKNTYFKEEAEEEDNGDFEEEPQQARKTKSSSAGGLAKKKKRV